MEIDIRQESARDHAAVYDLVKSAFEPEEGHDPDEPRLVERLRGSQAFIPELSLVAEYNQRIVGHIMLTRIKILNKEKAVDSLALAPVSVLPEFQGNGIGGKLILQAHEIAKSLGHGSIVLLGHETYYPRFGYQQAKAFDIQIPIDAPDENCMAIELIKGSLEHVRGVVEYPEAFGM